MDETTARAIAALATQWFSDFNGLLRLIHQVEDAELRGKMVRALGVMAGELEIEIMGPVYRVCPDLRPSDDPPAPRLTDHAGG